MGRGWGAVQQGEDGPLHKDSAGQCPRDLGDEKKREGAWGSPVRWALAGAQKREAACGKQNVTQGEACETCLFACFNLSCGHAARHLSKSGSAAGVGLALLRADEGGGA